MIPIYDLPYYQRRDRIWTSGPLQCADKVNWNTTHVDSPNDFPLHARASITLPLTAEELYFIAEGALSFGAFYVVQTPDVGPDNALVDVEVSFHNHEALLDATVCRLHPSDAKWGFGIFVSHFSVLLSLARSLTVSNDRLRAGNVLVTSACSDSTSGFFYPLHSLTPRSC